MSPFPILKADQLNQAVAGAGQDWLWEGYLAGGNVTLLTSQWKSGKTTLLTGLLRAADGVATEFLGIPCRVGFRSLVVTEESVQLWADRNRRKSLGKGVELLPRPFPGRPTVEQWNELIEHAVARREAAGVDLLVIDPLASFLPGHCENNSGMLLEALQPLHRFAAAGGAVLLLHHPRKKASEEGATARGSGSLLGFVDVSMELHRVGALRHDFNRRRLVAQSRHPATRAKVHYEWNPATEDFTHIEDPASVAFQDNWNTVLGMLKLRGQPASHQELLMDWPTEDSRPSSVTLYTWLNRAFAEKKVLRQGRGTKADPYRYLLGN